MAPRTVHPPASFEELARLVARRGRHLSPKLRQIADYVLRHPDEVALDTVSGVARRAGATPSAVVRCAQALGFQGFSELQRLLRERLVTRLPAYTERIRRAEAEGDRVAPLRAIADETASRVAELSRAVAEDELRRAVELVVSAELVHLAGQRRSFPVAAYLAYAFAHLGLRTRLLDGAGGMLRHQSEAMGARDLLVATSFRPYAPETVDVVERAHALTVPVIAITDRPSSPIAAVAEVAFLIDEAEVQGVRGLGVVTTLAAALVLATGRRLVDGPQRPADGPRSRNARSAT